MAECLWAPEIYSRCTTDSTGSSRREPGTSKDTLKSQMLTSQSGIISTHIAKHNLNTRDAAASSTSRNNTSPFIYQLYKNPNVRLSEQVRSSEETLGTWHETTNGLLPRVWAGLVCIFHSGKMLVTTQRKDRTDVTHDQRWSSQTSAQSFTFACACWLLR